MPFLSCAVEPRLLPQRHLCQLHRMWAVGGAWGGRKCGGVVLAEHVVVAWNGIELGDATRKVAAL